VVSLLLADTRIDVNKPILTGLTPFSIACRQGHKEVVSLLLNDPRIEPNEPDDDGRTPFFVTCQEGHKDVVSLLVGLTNMIQTSLTTMASLPSTQFVKTQMWKWCHSS